MVQWRAEALPHFPIVIQHYDELIFHYFLTIVLAPDFNPILPWWTTLALNKFSTLAFLFIAFRKMGLCPLSSFVSSLFMMMGTFSLAVYRYYMIFDSSNPLYYTVHSGRIVGISLCLFLVVYVLRLVQTQKHLSKTFFLLSGIGLASTSISNSLALFFFFIVWLFLAGAAQDNSGLTSYLVVGVLFLLYGLPFDNPNFYYCRVALIAIVLLILGSRIATAFFAAVKSWKSWLRSDLGWPWILRFFILAAALGSGLLIFGNIAANNILTHSFLQQLAPKTGPIPLKYFNADLISPNPFQIGDFRELGTWNEYSKDVFHFTAYYGVILAFLLMTQWYFERSSPFKESAPPAREKPALYGTFLAAALGMPPFFLLMDFTNVSSRAWIKSRFLELPVYVILFVFLYFIFHEQRRWQKRIWAALLFIYIAVPFFATSRHLQIAANARVFLNMVKNGASL